MRSTFTRSILPVAACLALAGMAGYGSAAANPAPGRTEAAAPAPTQAVGAATGITARELVQPGALMGEGPSSFAWSPHGAVLAYVAPAGGRDVLRIYDAETGARRILLDPGENPDAIDVTSAQWSPKGDRILLTADDGLRLVDAKSGRLTAVPIAGSAVTAVGFAPSGGSVAYVQDNDLRSIRLADGTVTRLTTDGSETVFNGNLDWVYNEELATRSAQPAYAWSPDGRYLIHLRLDESAVQDHPTTDFDPVPPTIAWTRYPVVGTANPAATVHAIDLATGKSTPVPLPAGADEYVMPLFTWSPDSREAFYMTEDRDHTVLELHAWDPATGTARTVIRETDPTWINENSYAAPVFLGSGDRFLWLSERSGFMHLYLYDRDGTLVRRVTSGDWMIDSPAWNLLVPGRPVFVDPTGDWAYFSATKDGPLQRQVYRAEIATGTLERVSRNAGFHFGALSGDGRFLVDQWSDVATTPATWIVRADGTRVAVLGKSAPPSLDLPDVTREFVTVKAHDGTDLYAQMVLPGSFDPARKYPVIVHWYGGPTLQMVSNRYGATNLFNMIERDTLYTQAGFIVWRLDNRGTFGRGHAFETPIFGELGKAALDDQLAGIEYLRTLRYVDASRIGADGKSFGGYLSLYALENAPGVFKAGVVASAPTDWAWYDTIYTERYMRTPAKNPQGFASTDLVSRAGRLVARPLIIHGLNDRNVHLQNSINLVEALEALDKPFDFLPLPNLDHGYKGNGLVAALSASTDYFRTMLAGPGR